MLDTLLAFAALLALCVFFAGLPRAVGGLAPLCAVATVVLYFSLAGVAGVLRPAGVVFYILAAALCAFTLWRQRGQALRRLLNPGFLLFAGGGLVLLCWFAIRQPVLSEWDEFSFWGTAAKLTKLHDELYTTAPIGWPWPATQYPALPLLGYFAQFFGAGFAAWKVYWVYGLLYLACFGAVLAPLALRQWRQAVPAGIFCLLLPSFFSIHNRLIYLDKAWLSSYGDLPAGILFGGVLAAWFTLRSQNAPVWQALLPLAAFALVKYNAFPIVLVAAGIMAADTLLFGRAEPQGSLAAAQKDAPKKRRGWPVRLGRFALCFAAPLAAYLVWSRHAGWVAAQNVATGGASTEAPVAGSVVAAAQQLLGLAPKTERFARTLAAFGQAFFNRVPGPDGAADRSQYPVSMLPSAFATVVLIMAVLLLAWACTRGRTPKRQVLVAGLLCAGGFVGYLFMLLISYGFTFKIEGVTDYGRYMASYLPGWLMLGISFLVLAARPGKPVDPVAQSPDPAKPAMAEGLLPTAAITALACGFVLLFGFLAPPWLTVLGYDDTAYAAQKEAQARADEAAAILEPDTRVFYVCQGGDGQQWFAASYYLLPIVLDYSITGGGTLAPPDENLETKNESAGAPDVLGLAEYADGVTPEQLAAYLAENDIGAIFVQQLDDGFIEHYGSFFSDRLAAGAPALYLRGENGLYKPAPGGIGAEQ